MKHSVSSSAVFLRQTLSIYFSSMRTVAVASLCFALLAAIVTTVAESRLDIAEDTMATELGIEWQELRTRVQSDLIVLSELTTEQLLREVEATPAGQSMTQAKHIGIVYAVRAGPALLLLLSGLLIIFFIGRTFFFLLFTAERTGYAAAGKLPLAVFGFAALGLWVTLRSLSWLPMVGPFVGAYTIPRLSLSSVYYARGGVGILQSASLSWARTKGLWLPVTLRLLLMFCLCLLAWWILLSFVGILALFSLKLASLLGLFGFFLLTAFFVAGLTVLAR
jgi:hypothetical protein